MLRVIGCITEQHDLGLVLLAALLCFSSCFTALNMIRRARAAEAFVRKLWLGGAGFMTGSVIWATHFVAMLAYRSSLEIGFDMGLTVLSALVAVLLSTAGYWLCLSRPGPVLGGLVIGGAIATMHYIGMAAVEIHADPIWSPVYVGVSILLGTVLTALAMKVTADHTRWQALLTGSLLFTLAVVGLHFTGMSAVVYRPNPAVPVQDVVLQPVMLATAIAAVAFATVALGLVGAMLDHHLQQKAIAEALRLHRYIDELEATKRQLLVAKYQAEAGSRAKSNFLSNMSHELRTPLNAIIGFADLISHEMLGPIVPCKYGDYVQDIHRSGQHLLSLINDILDLAKIEAGQRKLDLHLLDPAGLAQKAMGFVEPQAAKAGVRVQCEIAAAVQLIGDERSLVQILTNLLSNAVKFSHPGGTVRLFARRSADGGLVLGVEDQGIGMTAEGLKEAQEPFGQAAPMETVEGRGSGLGLPIVKALVEAHGGMLRLESELDKGTRAFAEFPLDRVQEQNRAA
jgi:signal transduction histidine kinase